MTFHGRWRGRKVSVEAGFDASGDGSAGGGDAGDVIGTGSEDKGERDVYVDVDIGDGGQVGDVPSRRPVDPEKAFDNPAMVVDREDAHESEQNFPKV